MYREFKTNKALVDFLIHYGRIHSPLVKEAFYATDRVHFVPEKLHHEAYEDYPLPIGHHQTISQPTTVAIMLEMLSPQTGHRVLDIGSGSGYTTALLAHIAGREGSVTGTERIPELVTLGHHNLLRAGIPNASIQQAGHMLGLPDSTFDCILVSAAADRFPEPLLNQLVIGGRIVIPVRNSILSAEKISETHARTTKLDGFAFVPLIEG